MSQQKPDIKIKSNDPVTLKLPGVEFSGPAWLAIIFVIFAIIYAAANNPKIIDLSKYLPNAASSASASASSIATSPKPKDPCDVPWKEKPLSCPI